MSLISLHPNYFRLEGFGTLMSHYALMYCIYKDTGYVPTILDIDFKNQNIVSAMEFFNQFDHAIINHQQVFPNLASLFKIIRTTEINQISWKLADLRLLNYEEIIRVLSSTKNDILCLWTLQHDLINKYISEITDILFEFDTKFKEKCQNLLPKTNKSIVGICVRTEYKKIKSDHIYLSINFYKDAMDHYDINNTKYLIFSDNINEAKFMMQSLEADYDIEYTNAMPSAIGMCTMSLCDHIISANSSFSYWAGLLNKNANKKILCPCKFMKTTSEYAKELNYKWYPSKWLCIETL